MIGLPKYLCICVAILFHLGGANADETCGDCSGHGSRALEGHPADGNLERLVSNTRNAVKSSEGSSKESYQGASCLKFERMRNIADVEMMIEDMEESPYASSLKEFWTTPACDAPMKTDSKVPIIFNTATDVYKSEKFPEAVRDYFVNEKKDNKTWLSVINTKSSDGLTFLDFLHYNISKGYYSSKATSDAAARIVSYLCKNGGVYSKYKNTAKCP